MLVSNNRLIGAPVFSAAAFTCFAALGLLACSASDVPAAGAGGSGTVTAGSSNTSSGGSLAGGGVPSFVGIGG